jgi:polysaccharide deacetylase 2 family uncharacterized protein YibQ
MRRNRLQFVWWAILAGSLALVVGSSLSAMSPGRVSASIGVPAMPPLEERIMVPLVRTAVGTHSLAAAAAASDDEGAVVGAVERPDDAPHDARERGRLAIVVLGAGRAGPIDAALEALPIPVSFVVAADAPNGVLAPMRANRGSIFLELPSSVVDAASAAALVASMRRVHARGVVAAAFLAHAGDPDVVKALAHAGGMLVDTMPNGEIGWYGPARAIRLPRLTRDFFLDAHDDDRYRAFILREALALAHRTGRAVAFAHASTATIHLLATASRLAEKAGVDIVPAADLAYR